MRCVVRHPFTGTNLKVQFKLRNPVDRIVGIDLYNPKTDTFLVRWKSDVNAGSPQVYFDTYEPRAAIEHATRNIPVFKAQIACVIAYAQTLML